MFQLKRLNQEVTQQKSEFNEVMRLDNFYNKKVYIVLKSGWNYRGVVIKCEEDSIVMIDFKGESVFLSNDAILTIREVKT